MADEIKERMGTDSEMKWKFVKEVFPTKNETILLFTPGAIETISIGWRDGDVIVNEFGIVHHPPEI